MSKLFFGKITSKHLLFSILGAAFLIRVLGISYGLPYHLFADEEAIVYSAIKMIELRTFLPVLHWEAFKGLLYYPPFLSYIDAFFFLLVLPVKYLMAGLPALPSFKAMLIFDPSIFWYVARIINVLLSVANLYLVYRLAHYFFKDRTIAIFSTLFFGFSFIDATLSHTARHWIPGLFFGLLATHYALKGVENSSAKRYPILAGMLLGISFGISYLVFLFPIIILALIYFLWQSKQALFKNLFYFIMAFAIVSLCALAMYPQAFIEVVFEHNMYVSEPARKTWENFLKFYAVSLWYYDTPLAIFSVIGGVILFIKQRKKGLLFISFLLSLIIPVFMFLTNKARYLSSFLPFFAMLSAYGLAFLRGLSRPFKLASTVLIIFLAIYYVMIFARYDILLWRDDTRLLAKKWIETTLPQESKILFYSERLKLAPKKEAVATVAEVNFGALRALEKTILTEQLPYPGKQFFSYGLFNLASNSEERKEVIEKVFVYSGDKYLITDSWAPEDVVINDLEKNSKLIKRISGSEVDDNFFASFIGGEDMPLNELLIKKLWSLNHFGPTVFVYKL